jgi:hypothetical protein
MTAAPARHDWGQARLWCRCRHGRRCEQGHSAQRHCGGGDQELPRAYINVGAAHQQRLAGGSRRINFLIAFTVLRSPVRPMSSFRRDRP